MLFSGKVICAGMFYLGCKLGHHGHWMLVWVRSILDPSHPLCDADPEPYFSLHMVPPEYQPRGMGDCGYLSQSNQAYFTWLGLICLGRPPDYERETPII